MPTVSPADLRAMWEFYEDVDQHPDGTVAVDVGDLQHVCPKADLFAVGYRCAMLQLIERHRELREAWQQNDRLKDAVVEVLAKIPMEWMPVGVTHKAIPFDVESFVAQVLEATA